MLFSSSKPGAAAPPRRDHLNAPPRNDHLAGPDDRPPSDWFAGGIPSERQGRLDWATLLRRTWGIDALACPRCGNRMRIVSMIEDPATARKIVDHLGSPHEPGCAADRGGDSDSSSRVHPPATASTRPPPCNAPQGTQPTALQRRVDKSVLADDPPAWGGARGAAPGSSKPGRFTYVC
jgi:hypothetical protein